MRWQCGALEHEGVEGNRFGASGRGLRHWNRAVHGGASWSVVLFSEGVGGAVEAGAGVDAEVLRAGWCSWR
jgi:hypothetical protein